MSQKKERAKRKASRARQARMYVFPGNQVEYLRQRLVGRLMARGTRVIPALMVNPPEKCVPLLWDMLERQKRTDEYVKALG